MTYNACHVEGQYVAMTFDDGPHAQNTPRLLDMLKERHIHATFFLVGENAAQYPQIIKRMGRPLVFIPGATINTCQRH